jgi:hypothetical protein
MTRYRRPPEPAQFSRLLAGASGNLLAQLEALSEFGHNTVGVNLRRGLAILRRAQALADRTEDDGAPACDRPLLPVQRARLAGLIGVAVFDAGGFGEAETWLRRSLATLRELSAWEQAAALISNYLGSCLQRCGVLRRHRMYWTRLSGLSALTPTKVPTRITTWASSAGSNLIGVGSLLRKKTSQRDGPGCNGPRIGRYYRSCATTWVSCSGTRLTHGATSGRPASCSRRPSPNASARVSSAVRSPPWHCVRSLIWIWVIVMRR